MRADATTAVELFERRAEQAPDEAALVFGAATLSRRELDRRAEILAQALVRLGIRGEDLVALHLGRGLGMAVAMLAVHKAGAAYVPLDPTFPPERLERMTRDADVRAVLSNRPFRGQWPSGIPVVPVAEAPDGDRWADVDAPESRRPEVRARPDGLAYVIYTSGSTGRPKGVQVTHGALVNFLLSMKERPGFGAGDVLVAVTTLSFDIAGLEIFLPLIAGGRLVIAQREVAVDGDRLAALLDVSGATVLQATPATWKLLLQAGWRGLGGFRTLCGGEALPRDLARRLLEGGADLWNLYGPTETTIWSAVTQVRAEAGPVPIGRPIDRTELLILNRALEPVADGAEGELFLGGAGLARGYLRRPGLTAERFVPHLGSSQPGGRLYRTGDLARFRSDGQAEFLGRTDHQVKIRGFRIELGEIESLLLENPEVAEAVVVTHGETPESQGLAAYVVPKVEAWAESRSHLVSREQVEKWREIWDQTYGDTEETRDPLFNTRGWNSSYSGLPIPDDEMREWVDGTVARILGLRPQRILEIGFGTGLLLFRLAPSCSRYVGTDISSRAVRQLEARLAEVDLPQVGVLEAPAHDLAKTGDERFDLVVLNSVIQYFPSAEYLLEVLAAAIPKLAPGGAIFLGDVRNLALQETFHASLQLMRVEPSMTVARFRQQVRRQVLGEEELTFDPAFFKVVGRRLGVDLGGAAWLRRGRHHNEMSCFRYDVVLRPLLPPAVATLSPPAVVLDWDRDGLSAHRLRETLREWLAGSRKKGLRIRRLPNRRLEREVAAWERLSAAEPTASVASLTSAFRTPGALQGVDPEDLWTMGDELSHQVEISWSGRGDHGRFDVFLSPTDAKASVTAFPVDGESEEPERPWTDLFNDPLRRLRERRLAMSVRERLRASLPDYMVPASVVVLEVMPLTLNRKVDRKALSTPVPVLSENGFVTPRTPIEKDIAEIWCELLGVGKIGIHDDFFALGGHSLLAGEAMARLSTRYDLRLTASLLFENPTPARLAAEIETWRGAEVGTPPLEPAPRDQPLPVSYSQERLWLFEQFQRGTNAFNMPYAFTLRGSLSVGALDACLEELTRRHEVLRTRFGVDDGEPVQLVDPPPRRPVRLIDLAGLAASVRQRRASLVAFELGSRPFDLATGPLLRVALVKLADDEHVLSLTVHHILCDGWSLGVFVRELTLVYNAFAASAATPLPELAVQYGDFAVWQRGRLRGELLERQLAYWEKRLGDEASRPARSVSALPTDYPRSREGGAAAFLNRPITRELRKSLYDLGREQGATLFMTLLAAVELLLFRYTGDGRVVVGSLHANRPHPALESLIGFFVNVLPLRCDLAAEWTFRKLLSEVRESALGAYAHQDAPDEKILKRVRPGRAGGRNTLYQVMVINEDMPLPPLELTGLAVSPFELGASLRRAAFDLTWSFVPDAGELKVFLEYDSGLFEERTIERMLTHFDRLLHDVVEDPDRRLSMLPTSAETRPGGSPQSDGTLWLTDPVEETAGPAWPGGEPDDAQAKAAAVRDRVAARRSKLSEKKLALVRQRLGK